MGRHLVIKSLPDGRLRIHWFKVCSSGPIKTPEGMIQTSIGAKQVGGVQGMIACNPEQNNLGPVQKGMDTLMCLRSDDPRAVTCPECMATEDFKKAVVQVAETPMKK